MSNFVPCPACNRHVLSAETACPFCTAALPESLRLQTPAPFLGDEREVAQPLARDAPSTVLLGAQHGEPAQLGGLVEVARAESVLGLGERADGAQRAGRFDELRGGLPQHRLVVVEEELHEWSFPESE